MHVPALPVYTAADAVRSLNSFEPRDFDAPLEVGDGIEATFLPAGHILGAAQIHINVDGHSIHFSGDLGRADDPLMFPPRELEAADILVTESTYGNRRHPDQDAAAELGAVVSRVAKRGGVVMIAAFAVGRAETLMLHLSRLRRKHLIPDIPIYLNSPMAIDASYMYRQHPDEHRLLVDEFEDMYKLATMSRTADDSKLLNLRGGPMVIISASGMLTGEGSSTTLRLMAGSEKRHHPQRLPGRRNTRCRPGGRSKGTQDLRPGRPHSGRGRTN
ncbi:uncharacterized protein MJ0162 [Arthrobacter sp. Hiyo8]|nr:uncharacterized protein MJ0162 [Arthrobacter sp. Hiyo8]